MQQQLLNHISRNSLCNTTDKILLAVSGGVDSMVMVDLFARAGFSIGIAHCNFGLRGAESEGDHAFVRDIASRWAVPFFSKKFDMELAGPGEGSTQMRARELRYAFFRHAMDEHGFDVVATAHHLDDQAETVLLNLTRGTGIEGLTGIPLRHDRVIRPLLFASRRMIEAYAVEHKLVWREDSSNAGDGYKRNFIRHQIIPAIKEINPIFEETLQSTTERLNGTAQLAAQFVDAFRIQAVSDSGAVLSIHRQRLHQSPAPAVLLWELIRERGFNFDQCRDIVRDHQPGKKFLAGKHQLVVDREHLIIHEELQTFPPVIIHADNPIAQGPAGQLHLTVMERDLSHLQAGPDVAYLDLDKLVYPLVWRVWQPGDFFVPLGMQGRKKLSDFLVDEKVSQAAKAGVSVIASGEAIAWVVGRRISENFKVTPETRRVLRLVFDGK